MVSLAKDYDLWFHDGNVVILAEQTYFRVHANVIMRWSDNFFDLAQPISRALEEWDVPNWMVKVSDSAHEIRHLFHILYDGFE